MSSRGSRLELQTVVDNTRGLRDFASREWNLTRDASIELEYRASGDSAPHYAVHAWGRIFPSDRKNEGRLELRREDVDAGVDQCRAAWQRKVIELRTPDGRGGGRFPFADGWDLGADGDRELLARTGLELARAGHDLYLLLYRNGDDGLCAILDRLVEEMRAQELVLTFHSEDCFVPWRMLYTPLAPGADLLADDAAWELDGFWGARHVIEQQFPRAYIDSALDAAGGEVLVGLNLNANLDVEYPATPPVQPVVDFFHSNGLRVAVRKDKLALRRALSSPSFGDVILYFGCHGYVGGAPRDPNLNQPHLRLTDDEAITTTDVLAWIGNGTLASRPVVFINACQGGQMESRFYRSFGPIFLERGANCVLGAQVDLPAAFSAEFALRLFRELFAPQPLGPVLRELTRRFAEEHFNPLGLIYSLYHGTDTRFTATIGGAAGAREGGS